MVNLDLYVRNVIAVQCGLFEFFIKIKFCFDYFNGVLFSEYVILDISCRCVRCMSLIFAAKQDRNHPERWMPGKASCPTCRAIFCVLDVSFLS